MVAPITQAASTISLRASECLASIKGPRLNNASRKSRKPSRQDLLIKLKERSIWHRSQMHNLKMKEPTKSLIPPQQRQWRKSRQIRSWSCAPMPFGIMWSSAFAARWIISLMKTSTRTGTFFGPIRVFNQSRSASCDLHSGLIASLGCRP